MYILNKKILEKKMKLIDILLEAANYEKVIDGLFKEVPEFASIGTKDQYADYLETVFPNSKIKDIVYHGGTLDPKDRGKMNLQVSTGSILQNQNTQQVNT